MGFKTMIIFSLHNVTRVTVRIRTTKRMLHNVLSKINMVDELIGKVRFDVNNLILKED